MAEDKRSDAQKEIERGVDQWRAMQGLPPIDRSKEARHPEKAKKET